MIGRLNFVCMLICTAIFSNTVAQTNDKLDSLVRKYAKILNYDGENFSGDAWSEIVKEVRSNEHIMIGEDHFTNEIPAFTKAIFDAARFENFYIEVDPYTTRIIERSINELNGNELISFNKNYSDLFSFYAKQPEYELLHHIVKSGTRLLGSDQIVMFSDRVIFDDLLRKTDNQQAKQIYSYIANSSKAHLEAFLKNPQKNPMFMMTPDFSAQLEKLSELNLSDHEGQLIKDLQLSKEIYTTQSHKKRVRLIMNGVMNDIDHWKNGKTLFKYGANHLTRGESFLHTYDIGNLVANITESDFKDTYHIMVVGQNGEQGSPFRGFPPRKVDSQNGFYLSYLQPFFKVLKNNEWYVFDMRPLRKEVLRNNLTIDNLNLERVIRGFDLLIIIPEVSAANHD